jgi:hypothetical protein
LSVLEAEQFDDELRRSLAVPVAERRKFFERIAECREQF